MLKIIRFGIIRVFNLNCEKRPYTPLQLLLMSAIIIPVSLFMYKAVPYLSDLLRNFIANTIPIDGFLFTALYYLLRAIAVVSAILIVFYACRMIWPRRRSISIRLPRERIIPSALNGVDEPVE